MSSEKTCKESVQSREGEAEAHLFKHPSSAISLGHFLPDLSERRGLLFQVVNLLGCKKSAESTRRGEELTILAISLCLFELRLVSSFIVLTEQFTTRYQQCQLAETHDLPEKIALSPYDTVDRFGRRGSDSTDGEGLGNGFRNAVKAFRSALKGDERMSWG
jgi:hypothetical protein